MHEKKYLIVVFAAKYAGGVKMHFSAKIVDNKAKDC